MSRKVVTSGNVSYSGLKVNDQLIGSVNLARNWEVLPDRRTKDSFVIVRRNVQDEACEREQARRNVASTVVIPFQRRGKEVRTIKKFQNANYQCIMTKIDNSLSR